MNIKNLPEKYQQWYDPEFCKIAVHNNPWNISKVKNKTPELCRIAINNDPFVIQLFEQKEHFCKLALKQNINCFSIIRNQTFNIIKVFIKEIKERIISQVSKTYLYEHIDFSVLTDEQYNYLKSLDNDFCPEKYQQWYDPEFCKIAVHNDPWNISKVKNKTPELCEIAVNLDGYVIQFVPQNETLCTLALKENVDCFYLIRNQTFNILKVFIEELKYQQVTKELTKQKLYDNIDFSVLKDNQYSYLKLLDDNF